MSIKIKFYLFIYSSYQYNITIAPLINSIFKEYLNSLEDFNKVSVNKYKSDYINILINDEFNKLNKTHCSN